MQIIGEDDLAEVLETKNKNATRSARRTSGVLHKLSLRYGLSVVGSANENSASMNSIDVTASGAIKTGLP